MQDEGTPLFQSSPLLFSPSKLPNIRENMVSWKQLNILWLFHPLPFPLSPFPSFFPFILFYFSDRGIAGDLYLVVHVNKKHGIWRDGLHLYSKINIDYTEAILGTVIKVKIVITIVRHGANFVIFLSFMVIDFLLHNSLFCLFVFVFVFCVDFIIFNIYDLSPAKDDF